MTDNHEEISRAIGRLEGKVDGILEQNQAQFKLLYDHQKDINELKGWRASITGKITIITSIAGTLGAIVITFIKEIWNWLKS